MEGGSLRDAVKSHKFTEKHIAYVAREILQALKYLHSLGYAHRDLKTSNVMLTVHGAIKLIDFGLCADLSKGDRVQVVGTPYFMPPEMVYYRPHGPSADIWSYAVCLLEMYLSKPPNASSRIRAMFTIATQGLLQCIPSSISEEGSDFLTQCLQIEPKMRATAEVLTKHPFVNQDKLKEGITQVLKSIFLSASFNELGLLS